MFSNLSPAKNDSPKNYGYWRLGHFALGAYHLFIGVWVFARYQKYIKNTEVHIFVRIPEISIVNDGNDRVYEVTADEKHHIGSVSPIFIHALVSCFTAASHFASAMIYKLHGLKKYRPNPIRWIEYSITATLMTFSGFIGIGTGDLFFLLSICFLGVILQYCGYKVEETAVRGQWRPYFWVGAFIEIAIALPLIYGTAAASREEGGFGLVALMACYILYYSSFAVNAFYDAAYLAPMALDNKYIVEHEKKKREDRANNNFVGDFPPVSRSYKSHEDQKEGNIIDIPFMITDERYAILSVTSKTALFWITVGTLMYEVDDHDEQDFWLSIIWSSVGAPALFLIIFLMYQSHAIAEGTPFRWAISKATCTWLYNDSVTRDFYSPTMMENRTRTREMNQQRQASFSTIAGSPGEAKSNQAITGVPTLRF